MLTPGYEGRVQGFGAVDVAHAKLNHARFAANDRFLAAGPKLDEARTALLEAVSASVGAQQGHGNVAAYYAQLIRDQNERAPESAMDVPHCTEELDAVVATVFATFAAARKEYDDASLANREAQGAFGKHLGQTCR